MKRPVIILGGGLWGGLLAYRLKTYRPDIAFKLYEKGSTLGGNHTWSFHGSDFNSDWPMNLVTKSWEGTSVSFPRYDKSFKTSYHSITSQTFHEVVSETLHESLILNSEVSLEDALKEGEFVIDARGIVATAESGFQKFLGIDVELQSEHKLKFPVIMDAKVSQIDGFRFLYYLPWDEKRVLIEDTRYSGNPNFNEKEIEEDLIHAINSKGYKIKTILRREVGVLPIPIEPVRYLEKPNVVNFSGIFHDTTGYSLPDAVKIIDQILKLKGFNFSSASQVLTKYRKEKESNRKFFRLLNHMLFKAVAPHERYLMLEYFYQHPEKLIQKFYSGEMSLWDQTRFFMGKPPVSIANTLRSFIANEQLDKVVPL